MNLQPPSPRQTKVIWTSLTGLAIALIVGLVALLIWGLGQVLRILSPVIWPLAIAGVLAYLLDPVVGFLERRKLSRPKAIISVFVLALLIVAMVCSLVIPQIVFETRQLADKLPAYKTRVQLKANQWISNPPEWMRKYILHQPALSPESSQPMTVPTPTDTNAVVPSLIQTNAPSEVSATTPSPLFDNSALKSATDWISRALPAAGEWLSRVASIIASMFGIIAGLALVPVYAFYLLLEKRGIESHWTAYLPVTDSRFKDELVFVLRSINDYLIAFFRGQVLVAICDAVLYTTGFLIIDLPYAILIGASAVVLTMIPFLGAITICVAALTISVVQYGDWLHPLMVLGVFAVVQSLEGLLISPRIMGGRVGLHPLAIIIAVMTGTTLLGGLLGGVLAIPLAAVLKVLMARYVWKKRDA